jgi:ribosomal protein S18 acetylase RimI-like enzyme
MLQVRLPAKLEPFDSIRLVELVPMWRASFEYGVGIIDPHPLEAQRRYFLDDVLPHNDVRLALVGGQLVGFVAASPGSIAQLHVHIDFHRLGIGTQLLAWAQQQSNGSLWLYTFARNRGARAFYEHHGFVDVEHGFEPTWRLEDVKYRWVRPTSAD